MGAFKAYDIRGIYGEDLTEDLVYKVGYHLPALLSAKQILVGRDMRLSGESLHDALIAGITDSGADVLDIGLATTPLVYFSTVHFGVEGSVQITASHNPAKYNGLKISRKNAVPVGGDTGLTDLEKMCETLPTPKAAVTGKVTTADAKEAYLEFLRPWLPDFSGLKLAIDCSNGMSSILVKKLLGENHIYINDRLDGSFPGHEPNPLEPENVVQLAKTVVGNGCDMGIIYDGDADRVMFVDENGRTIQPDFAMALIGIPMFGKKGDKVVCDIRTSKSTTEFFEEMGFEVMMWKVGHVHAKKKIRENNAVFGGELAGHYYFRDFFCCDSALFATTRMLTVIAAAKAAGSSLSAEIDKIIRYHSSGEVNFKLERKDEAMQALFDAYAPNASAVYDFDGYRIEFPTWWFNIRKSNTEPYLRLVLEADSAEALAAKRAELTEVISRFI